MSGPVLAIDPGPEWSAWVVWCPNSQQVLAKGYEANADLRARIYREGHIMADTLAIEQIASYGMAVGAEVFQTCVESGRFAEAWQGRFTEPTMAVANHLRPVAWIPRLRVKLELCQSLRAKDSNIRQALIDRFGPPGTKKAPGRLYGISSHLWAALAVAVTWADAQRVAA